MAEISALSNLIAFPFMPHVEKFMLFGRRRFDAARARLDETIFRIIAERRASGEDRGDLLSMLLLATEEEGEQTLSDAHLRDEVMTIFLASHDTTANWLTWTWYLLAEHPDVEARLHEEVDAVLGGGRPTLDDLPRLTFTEMVLTESMRVLPPVWIISRKTLEDYRVGGAVIPKGAIVLMSQFLLHHDPRFFDAAERFDPDRWAPELRSRVPRFAYFPFGAGPRQCIGEQFARMEATLLVATIAQRWRLRRVAGCTPELQPGIVLRPKAGLYLIPEERVPQSSGV
jgi:cytochrome P450